MPIAGFLNEVRYIEVLNCGECPVAVCEDKAYSCGHVAGQGEEIEDLNQLLSTCPLQTAKQIAATISRKKR